MLRSLHEVALSSSLRQSFQRPTVCNTAAYGHGSWKVSLSRRTGHGKGTATTWPSSHRRHGGTGRRGQRLAEIGKCAIMTNAADPSMSSHAPRESSPVCDGGSLSELGCIHTHRLQIASDHRLKAELHTLHVQCYGHLSQSQINSSMRNIV